MKKVTALVLAIVLFCGCAEIKAPISSASQPEQPPIVSAPEKEPPEKPETEPDFKIPEREYKVIAELPTIMVTAYQVKRRHYDRKSMYFHPIKSLWMEWKL